MTQLVHDDLLDSRLPSGASKSDAELFAVSGPVGVREHILSAQAPWMVSKQLLQLRGIWYASIAVTLVGVALAGHGDNCRALWALF